MKRVLAIIGLIVWVIIAFILASVVVSLLFLGLKMIGIRFQFLSDTTLETVVAALTYLVSIAITIGGPWLLGKHRTTRQELGLMRLIEWKDIGLVIPAVILYMVLDAVLLGLAGHLHGFNATQAQDVGFSHLVQRYEYFLAFLTLVVVAPIAEETLFRGYLFGKIRKRAPFWVTMLLVSVTFASLHVPGLDNAGHFQFQWNVAVDVFALSLVLCALREITHSIWAGVLLHALKNGIAFYILFMVPLLHTIGG